MSRDACVLAGYFGFGNAGDELILQSVATHVRSRRWIILSNRPEATAKDLRRYSPDGHCEVIDRWNIVSLTRAFLRSRALVLGGGELFQARTSVASLFYYLLLPVLARCMGCSFVVFGVGIDPRMPWWGRRLTALVLRQAKALWVRDEKTAEILRRGGVRRATAVVPDPVWSWAVEREAPSEGLGRVLWILRFPGKNGSEIELWTKALNFVAEHAHWAHGFLAFHPELDMPSLSRLRAGLRFFHRLESWTTAQDLFDVIRRYDIVISMRFHGVLAAHLAGRPCVAVAGHQKVGDIAELLGDPVLLPENLDGRSLVARISTCWESDKGAENNYSLSDLCKKDVFHSFSELDAFLKSI
ncbi:MAG: polysaccharide pyruvyl transferase family protein [Elusimicrobia bacterium]|nr:polysaccharide pyruvyl transferase family protein [Elusimicrobiota bacterium]